MDITEFNCSNCGELLQYSGLGNSVICDNCGMKHIICAKMNLFDTNVSGYNKDELPSEDKPYIVPADIKSIKVDGINIDKKELVEWNVSNSHKSGSGLTLSIIHSVDEYTGYIRQVIKCFSIISKYSNRTFNLELGLMNTDWKYLVNPLYKNVKWDPSLYYNHIDGDAFCKERTQLEEQLRSSFPEGFVEATPPETDDHLFADYFCNDLKLNTFVQEMNIRKKTINTTKYLKFLTKESGSHFFKELLSLGDSEYKYQIGEYGMYSSNYSLLLCTTSPDAYDTYLSDSDLQKISRIESHKCVEDIVNKAIQQANNSSNEQKDNLYKVAVYSNHVNVYSNYLFEEYNMENISDEETKIFLLGILAGKLFNDNNTKLNDQLRITAFKRDKDGYVIELAPQIHKLENKQLIKPVKKEQW